MSFQIMGEVIMPKGLIVVYIWKKPSRTPNSPSFMSWAGSLFAKSSNEINSVELARKDSHIAISISTDTDNTYFSFWPQPLIQSAEPGGIMHSQSEDIQSMGRKADLVLIVSNADTDNALKEARYLAALWVNHLHFNRLPWEKQLVGHHKTVTQQNKVQDDNSTVSIYNILRSGIDRNKSDLRPMWDRMGNNTIETLTVALIAHPQIISDLSSYTDFLTQETVVLPEYPLYLKLTEHLLNKIKFPEERAECSSLQYLRTEFKEHQQLFIYCTTGDGKVLGFPKVNIETDHSRYD